VTARQANTGQDQQPDTCAPGQGVLPGQDGPEQQRAAQVVMTVLRLCRALERVSAELTPQQYRILKLAGAGGERSARLAERLAVARPTLTAIADGLVAAGYARRDAEPGDRRVVRLCLTVPGRAAVDRAEEAYAQWLDQLLAQAGEPDRLLDTLDLLNHAMDGLRHSGHRAGDGTAGHEPRRGHELADEHAPAGVA
jgi:DNA-binding MarR family transcriptional regulator